MNMDELKQLISIYVDGEATPEEEGIVLNALKDSAELRAYYQDLLSLSASLQEWPEENLSPDLEQTITKDISKQEASKMKKSTFIPVGATIAVAVLVLVMGQQYSKRALQGRIRHAADDIGYGYTVGQPTVFHSRTDETYQVVQSAKPQGAVSSDGRMSQLIELKQPVHLADGSTNVEFGMEIIGADKKVLSSAEVSHRRTGNFSRAMNSSEQEKLAAATEYQPYYLEQQYDVERGEKGEIQAFIQVFPQDSQFNTEQYDYIAENEFLNSIENPLSTFSIDVDTASYANLRRFLNNGQTPPADAVRIEEMINYFVYDYPQPKGENPFSVNVEVGTCPWNPSHQLAMIGLQGKSLSADTIPQSNLVFLIDVSGSMSDANKLPLLKQGFKMMVNQLRPEEKISIVTYAGQAGVLLDSVSGADKQQILTAIDRLQSGGSTVGAQGILTAYELAKKNLIPGGNNRVILATDGDFNIGVSSDGDLVRIIEEKRQQGIFLTVLGFGMGNYKDGKMEKLADKGNGNYYYIDTEREAKKVMVRELGSTLFTIAKDVKLQIEFNPAQVKAYRLIGYENRKLNKEDFNDDTKDAGELGAGHTVTAFYEIIPAGSEESTDVPSVDPLKYQVAKAEPTTAHADEIMTVKLRYKQPDADVSKLISRAVTTAEVTGSHSQNYQWASSVAEFGMLLRNSKFKGSASFDAVLSRARAAKGADPYGYNQELIDLVEKAKAIIPETYSTGYGFKVAE